MEGSCDEEERGHCGEVAYQYRCGTRSLERRSRQEESELGVAYLPVR
jgi:hypothetical protein